MQSFIELSDAERNDVCQDAAPRLGLPAASIEKDFWVTWTLQQLFALPAWGEHITFKGGTSLSKCWSLIDRFSEDVDVVIDRSFLGFGGSTLSGKKLKKLRIACSQAIRERLHPALHKRILDRMPGGREWSIEVAAIDEDPDEQTLRFRYPTMLAGQGRYVAPIVKLEFGARSDTDPREQSVIRPLLAEVSPDTILEPEVVVWSVAPRRTFWEKALLLHEETYRPIEKRRKPRMSRHYYDLHRLLERGVGEEARADEGLLERVVAHRRSFFAYSWMDYDTMRRGSLRLVPLSHQESEWRRDYAAMSDEMFFGDPPTFDEALATVREFESEINRK